MLPERLSEGVEVLKLTNIEKGPATWDIDPFSRMQLRAAARRLRKVNFEGIVKIEAIIPRGMGEYPSDVAGFNYVALGDDERCYSFHASGLMGMVMTHPAPVHRLPDCDIFDEYEICLENAIEIFNRSEWGPYFKSIVLWKPHRTPPLREAVWCIKTPIDIEVIIGANSGIIKL